MGRNQTREERDFSWGWIVVVGFIVIAAWLLCWYLTTYWMRGAQPWAARAAFGDMFGSVNALFSGFAFAGVIVAILLQRQELKLQREELRRSVEAQEKSEVALAAQAKHLSRSATLASLNLLIEAYQRKMNENSHFLYGSAPPEILDKAKYDTYQKHRDQYVAQVQYILNKLNKEVTPESVD